MTEATVYPVKAHPVCFTVIVNQQFFGWCVMKNISTLLVTVLGLVSSHANAADIPDAHTLDLLADYRILFSSERGARDTLSLFSVAATGGDLKQHVKISVNRRGEYEPALSPDGNKIAFTTYRYGGWKIAIADIDGSNVRRLTMDPQYAYDASWSPDSKRIVYRRIVNNGGAYFRGNGDIFSINIDGSNNINLSKSDGEHARNPAFSPDGKLIVYDAFVGDDLHIMLMDQNGDTKHRVPTEGKYAFAPSWSPGGKWLAHLRQDSDGFVDVWRMKPDGTAAENLTKSVANGHHAIGDTIQHWQYETHWSPDGNWIAFTADYAEKGNIDIYLISVKTGQIARLTRHNGADTHPFWCQIRRNGN